MGGLSIEKVPRYSQAEQGAVERIVGGEEHLAAEVGGRGVAHHDKEACVLQVEVGIGVDEGEVAQLSAAVDVLLHSKLVELRQEVWGVVLGEPSG